MTPEEWKLLRKKWIEALRSGKYVQGQGRLVKKVFEVGDGHGKEYCCLGVLGDVCGVSFDVLGNYAFLYDNALPGIQEFLARYPTQATLAEMNDSHHSFREIADFIEENL